MNKKISLADLHLQYKSIQKEIDSAIKSVIKDSAFIGNKNNLYTKKFETAFADYLGIKHCISVGNGTDAIEIALKSLGIGRGDEVIVPAISWIATSEAISNIGAKPVFADILPSYYTIDPKEVEKKITKKTRAIIPVHLYGLACEMDEIMKIAHKNKLLVVEDCAQAHGAAYKGKTVGTFGDAATFSFFPGKNLGAYGDAGAIITDNLKIAETCRLISNHGQIKKNVHFMEGRNSRMDGIQSAILSVKLPYLPKWLARRREIAEKYTKELRGINGIITPSFPDHSVHTFHLYTIQVKDRESLQKKLAEEGIETGVHYPTPLPFLTPYEKRHKKSEFPVARKITSETLSLPLYPEMTEKQISFVVNEIKKIMS
jgi:dTDP-4-amino-4,6-dideoxygalactose transaminase